MLNFIETHRALVLWSLAAVALLSTGITLEFENIYSDSISISVTVLAAFGLFIVAVMFLIDELESICNP